MYREILEVVGTEAYLVPFHSPQFLNLSDSSPPMVVCGFQAQQLPLVVSAWEAVKTGQRWITIITVADPTGLRNWDGGPDLQLRGQFKWPYGLEVSRFEISPRLSWQQVAAWTLMVYQHLNGNLAYEPFWELDLQLLYPEGMAEIHLQLELIDFSRLSSIAGNVRFGQYKTSTRFQSYWPEYG
jgi:hypothetical protein